MSKSLPGVECVENKGSKVETLLPNARSTITKGDVTDRMAGQYGTKAPASDGLGLFKGS